MKGQTLFIRPIQTSDLEGVRDFLLRHGDGSAEIGDGLLGKLVGDLAAVLTFRLAGQDMEVLQLVVRKDLRRKRIGRLMLDELERLAASSSRTLLRVRIVEDTRGFFQKSRFVEEGDFMVRKVIRAES